MTKTPIADYALISDCHSASLVSRDGSIDWLCRPRFDSPSVFGRILGDQAGHWSITTTTFAESNRRYLDNTMVLETTFRTDGGAARLIDAMALDPSEEGHDLGSGAPRMIIRIVEGIAGDVEFELSLAPRPEYGLIQPRLLAVEGGAVGRGGPVQTVLSAGIPVDIEGATLRARFRVAEGERLGFAVQNRTIEEPAPEVQSQAEILRRLDDTVESWRRWSSAHQAYEGPWSDLVYQSGRVLQALTYQPTGAIVAAPTTSLPEAVGGERNWDYRFAWVRDASFTLEALWVAACPDESHKFFAWIAGTVASHLGLGSDLQIMFGIGGEHDLSERALPHLSGWRDSRPVRVGNGAWEQRQLDVYGELLGAAQRLAEQLGDLDDGTKAFLIEVADAAAARWQETDQGIWEIRGEPRAFVYSKLMCWVALDQAIEMAEMLGADPDAVERWTATRDEIRSWILEHGWSDSAKAFVQAAGSDELDASNLMMPIVGFIPADDPRMLSTVRATEERLTDERGLVYRYRTHDGLKGEEGTFLLCTFWLAHAQALAGQADRARETFERAIAYANDVGLLAEEVDEASGELLGNYPQAFSHIGLINAAWAISQGEEGAS
jgi:GH15 family glucan-1,4-alpha-glucosidase